MLGEWAGPLTSLHTVSWHKQGIVPVQWGGTAIPRNREVGWLNGEGQTSGLGSSDCLDSIPVLGGTRAIRYLSYVPYVRKRKVCM